MSRLADGIANLAMAGAMLAMRLGPRRRLLQATRQPEAAQLDLLKRILGDNAGTRYGEEHGFGAIASYADYRDRVPVVSYEDLRGPIERQERTGEPHLTQAKPVMYARTSGTTGAAKLLPVDAVGLNRLRAIQRIFAYSQYTGSAIHDGRILAIGSPAVEGYSDSGIPCGSTTGMVYQSMPRLIRSKYVVPAELFGVDDYDAKYLAIAALGLRERNVTGLATANPSTLLRLLGVVNEHWERLVDGVASGRLDGLDRLTEQQASAFNSRFRADPDRAAELRAGQAGAVSFADIWPNLKGVMTWTGGSCGFALTALADGWPQGTKVIEAGYASSEFWGSINLDVDRAACVPTILDVFYEFVERSDWENGKPAFLTVDQIETGKQYYVVVTTANGLYRYDMNDIVEVTGRYNATPTIRFVQKGKGVTNITGEKLYESQVLQAMSEAEVGVAFFLALADEAASEYRLLVEPADGGGADVVRLAEDIDRRLCELNVEYAEKRASGRLKPLRGVRLRPGTGEDFRRHKVAEGQRDAQFKFLHLQYLATDGFDFAGHEAEAA